MKNIIVTGACGGLGQTVSRMLLDQGYLVWALDIDDIGLQTVYADARNCKTLSLDLTDEKNILLACNTVFESSGPINGFVHCAGYQKTMPLYLVKQNEIESMFKIHVFSAMTFCSYIAKKGKASNDCSIVLVSSVAAHEGSAGNSIYAAAKGALEGYLPAAASEFSDKSVRINIIVPGDIDTGMFHKFMSKMNDDQLRQRKSEYPFGFGKPENIADLVGFLISDKSSWITGQKIVIDGGHMCRKI